MDHIVSVDNVDELIKAQTQIWNTSFAFIKSLCLKCAVDLGIPDIINNHGQPITLSDLIASLPIHPTKTQHVYRLMRILVHSGFFSLTKSTENNSQDLYSLTPASRLLLKNTPLEYSQFVSLAVDPFLVHPFEHLTAWFKNDDVNLLLTCSGDTLWGNASKEPRLNKIFNDCMSSDSASVSLMVMVRCKEVFEGIGSLIDVGGGTGNMARAIAEMFPNMSCTVLDQPHVVKDLKGTSNLNFFGGDIFEAIPPVDAVLLKWILHDWTDEHCVKILKHCKEAIEKSKGKVIIIEIVIGNQTWEDDWIEAQLLLDMQMMNVVEGKERTEKEWAKLFIDSGFSDYKIHPILGPRSLIEVFP